MSTTPTLDKSGIYVGDAFEFMEALPRKSVDLIVSDMPYGVTAIAWDKMPDLTHWWAQCWRVARSKHTPVVLTSIQPFTSYLVASQPRFFRGEWIWAKNRPTGGVNAAYRPLRLHENILVFARTAAIYRPVMWTKGDKKKIGKGEASEHYNAKNRPAHEGTEDRYPTTILYFPMSDHERGLHPSQKPIALMEYLITTYSDKPSAKRVPVVLDPFCGSGTTVIAARNTGRIGVGCDFNPSYVKIGVSRLEQGFTPFMFEEES